MDSYIIFNPSGGSPDRLYKSLTGFFWSGRLELHCSFPLGPTFPSELCVSHPNTRESFDTTATQLRKHLLAFPWGGETTLTLGPPIDWEDRRFSIEKQGKRGGALERWHPRAATFLQK